MIYMKEYEEEKDIVFDILYRQHIVFLISKKKEKTFKEALFCHYPAKT